VVVVSRVQVNKDPPAENLNASSQADECDIYHQLGINPDVGGDSADIARDQAHTCSKV